MWEVGSSSKYVALGIHDVFESVHCVIVSCWCPSCSWLLMLIIALALVFILLVNKQLWYIIVVHCVFEDVHCVVANFRCSPHCCWFSSCPSMNS
jgi:hypothetical protein